ncbi:hypothetical protein ANANG_G00170940 [Anguilla anguilla]|uniref:Uncharacterized protein n=1 Tax=Anguilla anguilla TaxID=7936 RepID=A0A9D3RSK4_ANGAN|nr:hypothetical protein ANANG_G00170940 [Anguilla anguilla]
MDERRPLMPSPLWDYQWEKRISTFSAPPRHGVLGETNGGICLSQLMQQLDELNLRGEEPTSKIMGLKDTVEKCVNLGQKYSKIFLPTLNSKCNLSTGSAICCSPLEPTLLQGQLQRHQPDLKCYKALRSWSHHPKRKYLLTPRNNQGDNSGVAQSEIPLRITPAVVTHNHGLRDRRAEGQGTRNVVSSPYCLAPNRFEGPGAETSNSSSTGQSSHSSLFMDFPSDDSDLSDQERTSMSDHERTTVSAQDWATPVELELDLRPEPFDKDDPKDYSESREDRLPYPEVLPAPLKILDLTQNLFNRADWERRQSFIRQDPSLFVLANRLVEMERMQAATVQRERAKATFENCLYPFETKPRHERLNCQLSHPAQTAPFELKQTEQDELPFIRPVCARLFTERGTIILQSGEAKGLQEGDIKAKEKVIFHKKEKYQAR